MRSRSRAPTTRRLRSSRGSPRSGSDPMGLDRLAARMLAARPLRTVLTIIGIGLGVGVLAASLTLGAALDASVDRTVRDMVGRADLRVSTFLEGGLSDSAVQTIRDTAGVTTVAPVVEHRTFLGGTGTGPATDAVTILCIDPTSYAAVHDLTLVSGSGLGDGSEAVALISERLATTDGYVVGSPISLFGPDGEQPLRVVGILPGLGPLPGTGRTVVVPIALARTTFGLTGASRVDLALGTGMRPTEVTDALAARLSEPYVLSSPSDIARCLRASAATFQGTAALITAIVL